MEKKPRKKKALNVSLDTKNVDVEIKRSQEGEVEVTIDTPKVDVKYSKDASGNKELEVIIDGHEYEFESNGNSPHMPKGTIWKITGELLKIFLKKNLGKKHK